MRSALARSVAAAALLGLTAVAGGLGHLSAAPAAAVEPAAVCPGVSGVTVVVDFHELGGGVQQVCEPEGGGRSADRLFPAAGYPLTFVQRFPGFVCRVSGLPADDPCVNTPPAEAYWGLWWADGESGEWKYSSVGVGSLTIPAGGYVALSWNGTGGRVLPGADPTPHPTATPTPTPTPTRTSTPTRSPSPSATPTPSVEPTATPTPSPGPTSTPTPRPSKTPSKTPAPPSPTPTASPSTASATPLPVDSDPAEPAAAGDGGLPGWVAPSLVVLLLGAAAAVALARRRPGDRP